MADEPIISALPRTGFGSMSREQLIELAKHPPAAEGGSVDPMGMHLKASQVPNGVAQTSNALDAYTVQAAIGRRAYHRKQKEEVTIKAATEKSGIVQVQWDNGDISKVKLENLTLL